MAPATLKAPPLTSGKNGIGNDTHPDVVFNEVSLKPAGIDLSGHDLPAIEILAEMGVKISREEALNTASNFLYDPVSGKPYLVCTGSVAGTVVAAATISIQEPLSGEFAGKKILEITKLAVFEDLQGKGLGKLFVENIEATARIHDCQEVVAATVTWRTADFWSNIGYEPTRSSYGRLSPDGYFPGYKDFCKTIS